MDQALAPEDRDALDAVVVALEAAWNAGDGAAYAAPMAADADFVTIRAEHFRGREAIAAGHAAILRSIYAGSTVKYRVESARLLAPDVALLHVKSALDAPSGPLAGRHEAMFSAVAVRDGGRWQIAAFHNTLAARA